MTIETLLKTNVNEHTEKKNNLTYLSWAWAWAEALKADPKATYKVEMFGDKCYMDINGTAMVWVTVTLFDKPMTCQLPVMNYKNQAIQNPDAFAVNTAIMRCMTKALSLHGLGLYIYAGEDIPESDDGNAASKPKKAPVITPNQGAGDELPAEEREFLDEMAVNMIALFDEQREEDMYTYLQEQKLDNEQKAYIWSKLPSKVRTFISGKQKK